MAECSYGAKYYWPIRKMQWLSLDLKVLDTVIFFCIEYECLYERLNITKRIPFGD